MYIVSRLYFSKSYSTVAFIPQVVHDGNDGREHVSDDEQFIVEHPQSENLNKTSSPKKSLSRKQSYRRAIFESVVTPSKQLSNSSLSVLCSLSVKKSREELRALWRKAIMEQRLLIRMERENSKLRGELILSCRASYATVNYAMLSFLSPNLVHK